MEHSVIETIGEVERIIEYRDGRREVEDIRNTVLATGRRAMAKCLANQIGDQFSFYITRMLFGDNGTQNGVKRYVNADRNGLFGVTRLSKPVLSNIDNNVQTQVVFTSVITFEEAIGVALSEMALQMSNGDLYSMTTFPDLTKTEEMQIIFNWRLSMI